MLIFFDAFSRLYVLKHLSSLVNQGALETLDVNIIDGKLIQPSRMFEHD